MQLIRDITEAAVKVNLQATAEELKRLLPNMHVEVAGDHVEVLKDLVVADVVPRGRKIDLVVQGENRTIPVDDFPTVAEVAAAIKDIVKQGREWFKKYDVKK